MHKQMQYRKRMQKQGDQYQLNLDAQRNPSKTSIASLKEQINQPSEKQLLVDQDTPTNQHMPQLIDEKVQEII